MAKIGGFDPNLGVTALRDGRWEIGKTNLPQGLRLIPESEALRPGTLVFGNTSNSALLDRFSEYLAVELKHRELLSPDVFFETLESAQEQFGREAGGEDGRRGEGPLVEAARRLAEILEDKGLCDMLRNLVVKA